MLKHSLAFTLDEDKEQVCLLQECSNHGQVRLLRTRLPPIGQPDAPIAKATEQQWLDTRNSALQCPPPPAFLLS
ncbi:hypothetical protein K466DRAFT_584116 [Polyporus arcularius HHB13444]|uniref:Uncharacterized protein n=1 Tax=Polyporus arcularius HHB13444 TaxID=1314778 RepID=A0A5C3PP18_9APHY|nr:hypothetical protein K466DRAFT_584116 [Polyporus arcularius HHB13444]